MADEKREWAFPEDEEGPGFFEQVGRGAKRGYYMSAAALGNLWSNVPVVGGYYAKQADLIKKKMLTDTTMQSEPFELSFRNAIENPGDFGTWLASNITQGLVGSLPVMAASVISPALGIATGMGMGAGYQLDEATHDPQTGERRDASFGEQLAANVSGLAIGAFEGWASGQLVGRVKGLLANAPVDAIDKYAVTSGIGHGLSRVLSASYQQGGIEMATEGTQTLIENLGAMYGWEPDRTLVQGVAEAMTIGFASGAITTGLFGGSAEILRQAKDDSDVSIGRKAALQLEDGDLDVSEMPLDDAITEASSQIKLDPITEHTKQVEFQIAEAELERHAASSEEEIYKSMGISLEEAELLQKFGHDDARSWAAEVAGAVASGMYKNASDIAGEVLTTRRALRSGFERAALVVGAMQARKEANTQYQLNSEAVAANNKDAAETAKLAASQAQANLLKITSALEEGASETARTLGGMKQKDVTATFFDEASVINMATNAMGRPLTEEETENFRSLSRDYTEKADKAKATAKATEPKRQEAMKKAAQVIVDRTVKHKKKAEQTSTDLEDQKKMRDDLAKRLFKSQGKRGLGANIPFTPSELYLMGKVYESWIHTGMTRVEELVDKAQQYWEAMVPGIGVTDIDVYEALVAKNPNIKPRKKKDKTEIDFAVSEIKQQARLLERIRKLEEGIVTEDRIPGHAPSGRVRQLQSRLRELENTVFKTERDEKKRGVYIKQIKEYESKLGVRTDPDYHTTVEHARETFRQLRLVERTRAKAEKIRIAIAEGRVKEMVNDFRREHNPEFVLPEVTTARIEAHKAKQKLFDEYQRAQGRTIWEKTSAAWGIMRVARAMADFSGLGRQNNLPFMAALSGVNSARRKDFFTSGGLNLGLSGSIVQSYKNAFSADQFARMELAMQASPMYHVMRDSGLYFADFADSSPFEREELTSNYYLEKVPGVKQILGASNRHMASIGNMTRFGMMKQFLEANPMASKDERKLYARFVNNASGRGTIDAGFAKVMSEALYSPRFTASRIHLTLNLKAMGEYLFQNRAISKLYLQHMVPAALSSLTTLGLGAAAGLNVGTDAEDSDFLKIVDGNTRIDFMGGYAPIGRMLAQIYNITAGTFSDTPSINNIKTKNIEDIVSSFFFFKLSPPVHIAIQTLQNKDVFGRTLLPMENFLGTGIDLPRRPVGLILENLYPIIVDDIIEVTKELGAGGIPPALAALHGANVSTYRSSFSLPELQRIQSKYNGYSPHRPDLPKGVKPVIKAKIHSAFEDLYAAKVMADEHNLSTMTPDKGQARLEEIASETRSLVLRAYRLR